MLTLQERLADETQPLIVGEIAQAHDGSLGMCHAYIDALADAGAHAIKFQTHIAAEESTVNERFRVKFSYQDDTRYAYWRRMEFTEPQWIEIKNHADARGIAFLSTPFSVAAIELLTRLGVEAWKVGSGDTMLDRLLDAMVATEKPMIVSTGMSNWAEIDDLTETLSGRGADFTLMQCTTKYPTPLTDVGLNNLAEMKGRYGCRIGLSDHSGSVSPSMAAIARGFGLIEVHAVFDKRMFGPDAKASLTIEEIASLVRFADDLRTMDSHPVDKDAMASGLAPQKTLFGRSVALQRNLPAGHVLRAEDLSPKKPGDGIPWPELESVLGRTLNKDVPSDRLLENEDLG